MTNQIKIGDLRDFINYKSFKNGLSTEDYLHNNQIKLEWSIELFEGLLCLHSNKIVHGDINPKYNVNKKIKIACICLTLCFL